MVSLDKTLLMAMTLCLIGIFIVALQMLSASDQAERLKRNLKKIAARAEEWLKSQQSTSKPAEIPGKMTKSK